MSYILFFKNFFSQTWTTYHSIGAQNVFPGKETAGFSFLKNASNIMTSKKLTTQNILIYVLIDLHCKIFYNHWL